MRFWRSDPLHNPAMIIPIEPGKMRGKPCIHVPPHRPSQNQVGGVSARDHKRHYRCRHQNQQDRSRSRRELIARMRKSAFPGYASGCSRGCQTRARCKLSEQRSFYVSGCRPSSWKYEPLATPASAERGSTRTTILKSTVENFGYGGSGCHCRDLQRLADVNEPVLVVINRHSRTHWSRGVGLPLTF